MSVCVGKMLAFVTIRRATHAVIVFLGWISPACRRARGVKQPGHDELSTKDGGVQGTETHTHTHTHKRGGNPQHWAE